MHLPVQYYAHVLEALRGSMGCPICGEGKALTLYQVAASIRKSPAHTLAALEAAAHGGCVERVLAHHDRRHGHKGERWRLCRWPEPDNQEQARALVREVAEGHGLIESDLYGVGVREWSRVAARRCAMRQLRDQLHMKLQDIGRLFGGLNHSTVMWHIARSREDDAN